MADDLPDTLRGRYVVVSLGERILGPFDTYPDAVNAGPKHCGHDYFAVMRREKAPNAANPPDADGPQGQPAPQPD